MGLTRRKNRHIFSKKKMNRDPLMYEIELFTHIQLQTLSLTIYYYELCNFNNGKIT